MSTVFLSLWLATGFRIIKLLFMISLRWKETLSVKMAYFYKLKPSILWTYYRRKHQSYQKGKQSRWSRVAFTSAYNVDDIAKRLSSNSMFDTDAAFVVCNNLTNTHICNDKNMHADFKETSRGMVATIGGKLNSPSRIGTIKGKWKDDAG